MSLMVHVKWIAAFPSTAWDMVVDHIECWDTMPVYWLGQLAINQDKQR